MMNERLPPAPIVPDPQTILIVEDDPGIREMLVRMLDATSYDVVAIDGLSDPFEKVSAHAYSVLIIDLALGNTDAIDVLSRLARAGSSSDVILISGHSLDTLQRAASIARGFGHRVLGALPKPFRRKALMDLLASRTDPRESTAEIIDVMPGNALLREALASGWLQFWFQPQIDLRSGRICGLETLARIAHPQKGILSPALFIEEAGEQEKRALTGAAIDAAALLGEELRGKHVRISINVFGDLLADEYLMRQLILVRGSLGDDVPITIEITENDVGDNLVAEAFSTRARLHGLDVSIDDFGTAYATFDRLRSFSFTELKLERAIVAEMATDPRARGICRASVDLAHACNATAVAEGVETIEDLGRVCALGFDIAQGFLFARPVPHGELLRILGDEDEQTRIRDLVQKARTAAEAQIAAATRIDPMITGVAAGNTAKENRARHFLLVEDDPLVADMICNMWLADDALFSRSASLQDALKRLRDPPASGYDAVILDLQMPDGYGLDILPNIRDLTDAAVIIISGAGTSDSRADAINAGVDDYIMKPFSVRELKARLLRTLGRRAPVDAPDTVAISKAITLDLVRGLIASVTGEQHLTHAEILLLRALKDAEGHVATRQALSRSVLWRDYSKQDKSLDVCVSKLRRKIEDIDTNKSIHIKTIRGYGYSLSITE
ncbi:MAG: EAL domain-containing protein [Salinarimonas sp.]|nr:EAL domain-containing protein [Salinarimonas sp.]